MFQRPPRGPQHRAAEYNPLAPNPFVPPNLPGGAVPSVRMPQMNMQPAVPSVPMPQLSPQPAVPSARMPQLGQRGAAAPPPAPAAKLRAPKKMNTETDAQYQARLQRLGANPAAPPVPSSGGLQKQNTESNAQFQARLKRAAGGYPQPPKPTYTGGGGATMRALPMKPIPIIPDATSQTSPSDAMQPMQRDYFNEQAVDGSLDQLAENSRSSILPTESPQRDFYDRTGTTPLFTPGLMQAAPTRVPVAPGVNEELLSRLPSRSERDRSTMQPGGMGFTEPVEGDGYTFKGSGATPGTRFDAGMFRNRQDQIDFLDKKVADHMAQADENGVVTTPSGATRTIDSDPSSPTYGKMKITNSGRAMYGPSVPEEVRALIDDNDGDASILYTENGRDARKALNAAREPRRKARLAGEVYIDPATGAVSDYGRFNEAREARQERKDAARELRMRRAQLMNYGRTGGVTVAPGGGIGGPMTVGTQATFGPNMSLNQATRMAQSQLDQEERASDALRRVEQQQAIQNRLQAAQAMQDGPEKDALLQQISNDVLQPSDSAQVKPTPASARAKAERQVELNDAQQRQADEIAEDPISFYDNQMVALEGLETDEELDAYFNSEQGGVVYTPEQLLELNEQQILGLDQQLKNVGREGARQAGRSAGQFFGGPIGGFLGGLAGEYLMPNEGLGFTFGEEEIREKRATLERQNKKLKDYIARRKQR
jgi:hypothetical protein